MLSKVLATLTLAAALAGCGGGLPGTGSVMDSGQENAPVLEPTPPPPPAVAVPPAVPTGLAVTSGAKHLHFTWTPVAGATSYELLEDVDGPGPVAATPVSSPTGATASFTPSALLHTRVNAQYRVQACNLAACSAPSEAVTPDLVATIGYIKSSNSGGADYFGGSVALSADGTTLAIGADGEASASPGVNGNQADDSARRAGAVYVFTRSAGGTWAQQAYLKASNPGFNDAFGMTLALSASGDVLAVGAPWEDSGASGIGGAQADEGSQEAGAVYVFTRNANGSWAQQAYVKASNPDPFDWFGWGIALSGDGTLLAVGAPAEASSAAGINGIADNARPASGAVYLFRQTAGSWSQEAFVKASMPKVGANFGWTMALSTNGSTLAVGAVYDRSASTGVNGNEADASAGAAGAVYVFAHGAGGWAQQAYVKASNTGQNDEFGFSLAMSADGATLAVGARNEASAATGIDGDQSNNDQELAGAVYIFTRSGTNWSQQAYLKASNAQRWAQFGTAVALAGDGNLLVVGARGEHGASAGFGGNQADNSAPWAGAVYLFARSGSSWAQTAYLKAPNPQAQADFGEAVALSADGATVAVGAHLEDGSSQGVQGNQATGQSSSGAVYIY